MGDVLAELEEVLRKKPTKDKITSKEEFVLQTCKARAIGDFTVGSLASSAVVWIDGLMFHGLKPDNNLSINEMNASKRLTHGQRFNASVGSAIVAGMWRFNRSLNSCINQILELEGSRMQRELAQIILTKHHNNASKMKLVKKHFFSEEVFSDSNPDKPYSRWRFRNMYFDNSVIQRSEDAEDLSFDEKHGTPRTKQLTMRLTTGDMIVDPLDLVFGEGEANNVTPQSDDSAVTRKQLRAHKKARRHRAHHAETNTSDSKF